MDLNFSKVSMTKQEIEYVKALNLSPKMEALIKHPTYTDFWGIQYNWTNTEEGWYISYEKI